MCTGKCSHCIAVTLYPLAILSMICNVILFFPNWDPKYVREDHITEQVKYMGGLVGGGIMMLLSIVFAKVGVVGALYSLIVAVYGLKNGPLCYTGTEWIQPNAQDGFDLMSNLTNIMDFSSFNECKEPKDVVQFNSGLFGTLALTSCVQVLLCAIQMINGLFGCLCGTCLNK